MEKMKYELKPLPYDYTDLEPVISSEIMHLHHDKHHLAYVNGANAAIELLEKGRNGESINIKAVERDLSFNLNGHLLHELFWSIMRKPQMDNRPEGYIHKLISENFGSFDLFKKEFSDAAKAVEGSGWAALSINDQGNLLVHQIEKHNLLSIVGFKPVLVNDVWEHAYYLDYKNDRPSYVENWWSLVNWEEVDKLVS